MAGFKKVEELKTFHQDLDFYDRHDTDDLCMSLVSRFSDDCRLPMMPTKKETTLHTESLSDSYRLFRITSSKFVPTTDPITMSSSLMSLEGISRISRK
jgi:hypothetical protein